MLLLITACELCARTLDDFEDGVKPAWSDFLLGPGVNYEFGGLLTLEAPTGWARQPVFVASARASERLTLQPGDALELRADLAYASDERVFAVLAWAPDTQPPAQFAGYFIAKSGQELRVGKGLHQYFWKDAPQPLLKHEFISLVLGLTATADAVLIRAQVLDLDAGGAVLFDRTFTDTPAADALAGGTDRPAAPFGGPGRYVLMAYAEYAPGDPDTQRVNFDTAVVSTPAPTNQLPVIHDINPPPGVTFHPPTRDVLFLVTDGEPWEWGDSGAGLLDAPALAGGVGIRPGTERKSLLVDIVPGFAPNTNYTGRLIAVDINGGSNVVPFRFDTFCYSDPVIEAEDYNFGGGRFVDGPALIPEAAEPTNAAYLGQAGLAEVDFHLARPSLSPSLYRPQDPVGAKRSLDYLRAPFLAAAAAAETNVFDYDVHQLDAGDWLAYTRTIPENDYWIYLREAVLNLEQSEAVLELVTRNAQGQQVVTVMGRFVGQRSGFEYRDVPLVDATGRPVKLRLGGLVTWRLRQVTPVPSDAAISLNYVVFAPPVDFCVAVESAAEVTGPYAPDVRAGVSGKTVTIKPLSDAARFFRVQSESPVRIYHVRRGAGSLSFDMVLQ
jgi:hypothetical protein